MEKKSENKKTKDEEKQKRWRYLHGNYVSASDHSPQSMLVGPRRYFEKRIEASEESLSKTDLVSKDVTTSGKK